MKIDKNMVDLLVNCRSIEEAAKYLKIENSQDKYDYLNKIKDQFNNFDTEDNKLSLNDLNLVSAGGKYEIKTVAQAQRILNSFAFSLIKTFAAVDRYISKVLPIFDLAIKAQRGQPVSENLKGLDLPETPRTRSNDPFGFSLQEKLQKPLEREKPVLSRTHSEQLPINFAHASRVSAELTIAREAIELMHKGLSLTETDLEELGKFSERKTEKDEEGRVVPAHVDKSEIRHVSKTVQALIDPTAPKIQREAGIVSSKRVDFLGRTQEVLDYGKSESLRVEALTDAFREKLGREHTLTAMLKLGRGDVSRLGTEALSKKVREVSFESDSFRTVRALLDPVAPVGKADHIIQDSLQIKSVLMGAYQAGFKGDKNYSEFNTYGCTTEIDRNAIISMIFNCFIDCAIVEEAKYEEARKGIMELNDALISGRLSNTCDFDLEIAAYLDKEFYNNNGSVLFKVGVTPEETFKKLKTLKNYNGQISYIIETFLGKNPKRAKAMVDYLFEHGAIEEIYYNEFRKKVFLSSIDFQFKFYNEIKAENFENWQDLEKAIVPVIFNKIIKRLIYRGYYTAEYLFDMGIPLKYLCLKPEHLNEAIFVRFRNIVDPQKWEDTPKPQVELSVNSLEDEQEMQTFRNLTDEFSFYIDSLKRLNSTPDLVRKLFREIPEMFYRENVYYDEEKNLSDFTVASIASLPEIKILDPNSRKWTSGKEIAKEVQLLLEKFSCAKEEIYDKCRKKTDSRSPFISEIVDTKLIEGTVDQIRKIGVALEVNKNNDEAKRLIEDLPIEIKYAMLYLINDVGTTKDKIFGQIMSFLGNEIAYRDEIPRFIDRFRPFENMQSLPSKAFAQESKNPILEYVSCISDIRKQFWRSDEYGIIKYIVGTLTQSPEIQILSQQIAFNHEMGRVIYRYADKEFLIKLLNDLKLENIEEEINSFLDEFKTWCSLTDDEKKKKKIYEIKFINYRVSKTLKYLFRYKIEQITEKEKNKYLEEIFSSLIGNFEIFQKFVLDIDAIKYPKIRTFWGDLLEQFAQCYETHLVPQKAEIERKRDEKVTGKILEFLELMDS